MRLSLNAEIGGKGRTVGGGQETVGEGPLLLGHIEAGPDLHPLGPVARVDTRVEAEVRVSMELDLSGALGQVPELLVEEVVAVAEARRAG